MQENLVEDEKMTQFANYGKQNRSDHVLTPEGRAGLGPLQHFLGNNGVVPAVVLLIENGI